MCNAYKHPQDCRCGFGPPYDDVQVEIRRLPSPTDKNPSEIAELAVRFPVVRANFYWDINSTGKIEVRAALMNALQRLADDRFGRGNIRVKVTDIRKGSITFGVILGAGAVAAYKFFKDYDDLSKGVKTFCRDIQSASKSLRKVVHEAYHRVESRSHKKVAPKSSKKSSHRQRDTHT
ncbi:MAG: hypothetical protein ACMG6H_06415 [Acidobacteriota bacterium]